MAAVRKYRDRWVADFRDQYGRRRIEAPKGPHENKALEKRAAQELLTARLAEIERGTFVQVRAKLTFADVANRFLAGKLRAREQTRAEYRQQIDAYLVPYFAGRKIDSITPYDIERFRAELLAGLPDVVRIAREQRDAALRESDPDAVVRALRPGPRTINKLLVLLYGIFAYALRHGWAARNPTEGCEKVPEPAGESRVIESNVLTPVELQRVVDNAVDPWRLPILFAITTGARQSEVAGLQWGDIDWHKGEASIRRRYRRGAFGEPKTKGSTRTVELAAELLSELKRWKLRAPKGEADVVFPAADGRPMQGCALYAHGFLPALRRAGLRKVRFHDLRHSFASNLLSVGVDCVTVSRLLGHSSPHITMTCYAHAIPKARHGASERLAQLMRGRGNQDGNKVETSGLARAVSGEAA